MAAGTPIEIQNPMAAWTPSLFPGFRFSPTDVELISYYLKKKMQGLEKCVEVISEIDFCQYEPWDIPAKSIIKSENEWFFFCARGRKYPKGSQSKRATQLGYWKATGKERNVKSGNDVIGKKRALVFHIGRAPKGKRTEWIMHEFCMEGRSQSQDSIVICRLRKNSDFHLNNTSDMNSAMSEGGTDQIAGMSEGDKAVESCSNKCDSYYLEEIDLASESEQKLADDSNFTESSAHDKYFDSEEDFFAEILEDDIINLDEASLSATSVVPNPEAAPPQKVPLEGKVSRRIKSSMLKPGLSRFAEHSVESVDGTSQPQNSESQPTTKCFLTPWGWTINSGLVPLVFCVLISLAVSLSLCGGDSQSLSICYFKQRILGPK